MRRLSRSAAVAVALAVVGIDVALLWPGPASAAAPVAVGGWRIERQTTPAGALPTSPLTDDGTLAVRNGPAGVLAFAAVRYEADGGRLLLNLAGQPPPTIPAIDACPVTSSWTAGADQTWDHRPAYDCGHHVVATVSGTQLSWEVDSGFAHGSTLDVALVPDPADTTPYAVSFSLPTTASFQPNDDATTSVPPPPLAAPPAGSAGVPPASGGAPMPSGVVAPAAAAPVVAPASPTAAPQFAGAPTAATREPGSRAAGAAALAAFALILLVRSFVTAGARGHSPKSLLLINREGA